MENNEKKVAVENITKDLEDLFSKTEHQTAFCCVGIEMLSAALLELAPNEKAGRELLLEVVKHGVEIYEETKGKDES